MSIIHKLSSSLPTVRHKATKFGVHQILIDIITLTSFSGIGRICRIAAFSGEGLVKMLLKLNKAINENSISGTLKTLRQCGSRKQQMLLL